MSMFEFGFEEEFTDEGRLNDLIAAYEQRGESAYFDSDALEDIATHYFELTHLADELASCHNVHLDATEHNGKLVFLHSVREGPANQSYGLQVAALAGVPRRAIRHARQYLEKLEQQQQKGGDGGGQAELALAPPAATEPEPDPASELLQSIDADELTPRQALDLLYRLKEISDKEPSGK